MIEFKLKSGDVLKYDTPFILDESYYIKTRVGRTDNWESPWAYIHPVDKGDYENDIKDKIILVISANDCLHGIPYGALYPVKSSGNNRPECNMDELIDLTSNVQFYIPLFEHSLTAYIAGYTTDGQNAEYYTQDNLNRTLEYYNGILPNHELIQKLQTLINH